ncbi:DUF6010 family protein [Hyphomonas pacifica]|uniref:DUF6010 family protein n=1 Tax=Hyphomonas pacifica TaxID=1280941 RepID=UPI000DBF9BA9|nr:DUF6010 family protein [Hyphomonas pacifica]RAN35273.1 hypothetical protein HY11_14225 [Hyphomonas pacifica]
MSDMGQTHQHGASSQIHTFSPSIFLSAIVLGVAIPAHLMLPDDISRLTIAITIAIIAGAYIGFGANDGRPWMFLTELCIAALFGVLALLGVIWSPYMFVAALFLHGVWDLIHHNGLFGAKVPRWYIPFCVVIDWIAAAGLFILFAL